MNEALGYIITLPLTEKEIPKETLGIVQIENRTGMCILYTYTAKQT